MTIRTIPVAQDALKLVGLSVQEKLDSERVQRLKDGVPQWTVECLATDAYGNSDIFRVTITGKDRPPVTPHAPIAFLGLRAGAWSSGSNANLYYQADGVKSAVGGEK